MTTNQKVDNMEVLCQAVNFTTVKDLGASN